MQSPGSRSFSEQGTSIEANLKRLEPLCCLTEEDENIWVGWEGGESEGTKNVKGATSPNPNL